MKQRKLVMGTALLLLLGGGYWGYTKVFTGEGAIRYVAAQVKKGTLVVSISGSGQVSVSNQVDVKPKVSGDAVSLGVKNGQAVKAGTLLIELDARDAQKAVRDAQVNLESVRLALKKLQAPPDPSDLTQTENALARARLDLEKLGLDQRANENDSVKKKDAAATAITSKETDRTAAVASAFGDLPAITAGLSDILFNRTVSPTDDNNVAYASLVKDLDGRVLIYQDTAVTSYRAARDRYERVLLEYQKESRAAATFSDALGIQTEATLAGLYAAVGAANNFLDFTQDVLTKQQLRVPGVMATHQSSLDAYTGKASSQLSGLRSANRAVSDARQEFRDAEANLALIREKNPRDLAAAEQTVKDREAALDKLRRGADALDIQSQTLTVKQRENSFLDASEKLADYFIRAPFDGIVAKVNVKKGDPVSSATAVAVFITAQKLAEVSLNEIDVAKVKVGQRTTLTFDAVPGLSIAGQLAEIDAVGTVSQGVVSYTVKIAFDTQDDRVKPAMSASAVIITEVKPDVLLIPNSAIKKQGAMSVVEALDGLDGRYATGAAGGGAAGITLTEAPRPQIVQLGAANDELTEIISGLKEGDVVVVNTINPQAAGARTPQRQSGGFRIPGLPGGGGGGGRGGLR